MRNPVEHRPAFMVRERPWTWGEVVDWAERRGLVAVVEREVAEGLACLAELRRGGGPPTRDVRDAANDYRRELGLLSAEETEAWLARWGLTVGEWTDYIRRTVARQRQGAAAAAIVQHDPPAEADVAPRLWPTAVCSGAVDRFAEALAVRLAAQTAGSDESVDPETAYVRFVVGATTPEALRRVLEPRVLDWLRVDYAELIFADLEAAREGLLCLRDDSMPPADVAERAHAQHFTASALLADLPEELRPLVLGASAGDVLGPVSGDRGYTVLVVTSKTGASLDDPQTRARAEAAGLAAATSRLLAEHVRWHAT